MPNLTSDGLHVSPLRLALVLGLAAGALTGLSASPAQAVNTAAATGSEAGPAPAGQQVAQGWNRGYQRPEYRGGGGYYNNGPAYYYSAPPVVVVPQGYYAQPAPLFDLTIPLVIR
jgi:hypothetical protein